MPSDQPRVPFRTWRKDKPQERASVSESLWRSTQTAEAPRRRLWSKQSKIGLGVLTFLILTGMLIWASLWLWPPKKACLVLIGAAYRENLAVPHNVYGWKSLAGMVELAQESTATYFWGSERLRLLQGPSVLEAVSEWENLLKSFTEKPFAEKTVVVFLALHGGSDLRGAYFLPLNADGSEEKRLRLETVLDGLERLPKDKNKVLLLDATLVRSSWELGMLENDFPRELEKLDARIAAIPNLAVVSACDVAQHSWVSEEWGQTVFAHYVIEGLKGAASDRNNDGRINLGELFDYARPSVERWVNDNRLSVQTPVLFPKGERGAERARRMDLTVVRSYTPPDPRSLALFEPPAELVEAWKRYQRLDQEPLSFGVYTPQLWRRYRDLLLRFEQMLRAGDRETAAKLEGQLIQLEQEMGQARKLDLSSTQNTLAMPAAAGLTPPGKDSWAASFNELWSAPPADYAKRWAELQKGAPVSAATRLKFYEQLLENFVKDPACDLDKTCALMQVLDDPLRPRPAEAHFLAMMRRDRPRTPPPPQEYCSLLQLAVQVRLQAERTALAVQGSPYPYSEQVYPWIQTLVAEGDKERRLGEDLLFASDRASWERARASLQKAQSVYQEALRKGTAVRTALEVRDRVLADLPYYSKALARQRLGEDSLRREKQLARLRQTETLWTDAHQLVGFLEKARPEWIEQAPPPTSELPRRSLASQAQAVRVALDALEQQFIQELRELSVVTLQSVWRDSDDALTVPIRDYELRMRLLTNMRRTSRQLLIQTAEAGGRTTPSEGRPTYYKEHARRQGLMALAVLGKNWFNQCVEGEGKRENYQQVQHRLDTFAVESDWWVSLGRAGDEVGYRWREMPVRINRLTDSARQAALEAAGQSLQAADLLTRQIDGPGSLALTGDPVGDYRRLRVEGLLLWQAQRTLDDHWFAEDPNAAPYYRTAAQLYLNDAQKLDLRAQPRQAIENLKKQVNAPGELAFRGPALLRLTSEQRLGLEYALAPAAGASVPPGHPVVWLEPGKDLEILTPAGPGRLVRKVEKDGAAQPLDCTLQSPLLLKAEENPPKSPLGVPTSLSVRGLYRGQQIRLETHVELYPLAEMVASRYPPPQKGSIAVRAAQEIQGQFGASNGSIAIVLDCSGSMGPPQGEKFAATTKYREATDALKEVLQKLPKGVTVSVWVFGQALGPGKTVAEAEKTVRRLQEPVHWDPAKPSQLQDLMGRVEYPALEPWNESPIVRAMTSAKEDLRAATGFKTLLVITDGMDNRFDKDSALNPAKEDIPTFLKKTFADSGIVINIIGFKVVDEEEKKALEQFQVIEQLPLPGRFVTVKDSASLAGVLERALRQKLRYWIDSEENVPVPGMPEGGLDVSQIGENAQWFPEGLDPRLYKLRVHTDRRLVKDIAIERGELLLVDLAKTAAGLAFERSLYSRSDYPWKPGQEKAGWRLAVLQNQQVGEQALQMLATLEKASNPRETILQQLKPRETWLEVKPADAVPLPYAQRWTYQPGYPAPAWSLDVSEWPKARTIGPARPVLGAWWNPDQETPLAASLDRGPDFQTLANLANRKVQVEGDEVIVESVAVEEHLVETRPGTREKQSCLVVRLSHARGKPVWAQVRGPELAGCEQRFYAEAEKYTGLFWPVAKNAEKTLDSLGFVSLGAFKRAALERGFFMEMQDLKAPLLSDVRPQPPLTLK